jgi:signal transduction histidine kinase
MPLPQPLLADALDRTGMSVWEEDWSEVGATLAALRAAGEDPMVRFAAEPALLAALHGTVRITGVNQATLHLMGVSDARQLVGRLADVVPDSVRTFPDWVAALARGDRFLRVESFVRRADGSVRDCLAMARLPARPEEYARLLVCVADIADYKADQARLAEAEREGHRAFRTSAVGVLTAAIAHEVKNPLAAVVTNAEAALRWLHRAQPEVAEAEAAILALIEDALRARDVVDRTRLLLARQVARPTALDARSAVDDALRLVEHDLRAAGAVLQTQTPPGLPPVLADPLQLQQILTNLLRNAAQAVEGRPGRREVNLRLQPHPDGLLVEVADTGPGIPPQHLARVFEPFYSTKEGGLGVGLAICRSCAEANGGRIWASSPEGIGAIFRLLLPAAP